MTSMMNSLGGWFGFAWYALLLLVGGSMVLRSVWAPVHLRRGASCGACGYEISRADAPCPECGANLLKAGLNTPAAALRARGSVYLLAVGWLLVVASLGTPTYTVLQSVVGQQQQFAMAGGRARAVQQVPTSFTLRANPTGMIQSQFAGIQGPFRAIIDAGGSTDEWGDSALSVRRVELAPALGSGRGAELTRDLADPQAGWTLFGEWGELIAEDATLDDALGRSLLETAGFDLDDPAFSRLAEHIPELVEAINAGEGEPFERVQSVQDDAGEVFQPRGSSTDNTSYWNFKIGAEVRIDRERTPRIPTSSAPDLSDDPASRRWRMTADLNLDTDEWGVVDEGTSDLRLLTRDGGEARLLYDVETRTAVVSDADGETIAESERGLSRAASRAMFESAGLSRRDPAVGHAIKAVPLLIQAIEESPSSAVGRVWQLPGDVGRHLQITDITYSNTAVGWNRPGLGTGFGGGMTGLEWAMWGTLGGGAAIYLGGLFVLMRVRRRTLRPIRAAAS